MGVMGSRRRGQLSQVSEMCLPPEGGRASLAVLPLKGSGCFLLCHHLPGLHVDPEENGDLPVITGGGDEPGAADLHGTCSE